MYSSLSSNLFPHYHGVVSLFRNSANGSDAGHSSDVDSTHYREDAREDAEQERDSDVDSEDNTWDNNASTSSAISLSQHLLIT
jgi:hypothetical protein